MRDSVIFYRGFYKGLESLPDDARGRVYSAIMAYAMDGIEPDLDGIEGGMFEMARGQIDANNKKYEDGKKGGEYGSLGGRPKKKTPQPQEENPIREEMKTPDEKTENPTGVSEKTPNENVKENVKENVNDNDIAFCSEPSPEPPAISLPLNDNKEFGITQSDISQWAELYQAVNVMDELRKMKGWLLSNPTRRKTKAGIKRFITSWLAKEQDRGRAARASPKQSQFNTFQKTSYDYDALERELMVNGG